MSPVPSFADHTVTVVEPGTKLVQNSPVDDWSPAKVTTRDIGRALVEPATTEEGSSDPDTVRAGYKIKLRPEATPPSPKAKIRHPLAAGDYAVIGEVMAVPSPRGGVDHWLLYVERWKNRG